MIRRSSLALLLTIAVASAGPAQNPPAGAAVNRYGTSDLNLVVIPRARAGRPDPARARAGATPSSATRALMWRRPAKMGSQISSTGALAPH